MECQNEATTTATVAPLGRTGSLARALCLGAGAGALGGCVGLAFEFLMHRGQTRLADLAWPAAVVAWPIMGGLFGWLVHRNPEARGRHGFRRPEDYFAIGPVPDEVREARDRRVRRSVWTGFAGGVFAALASAAVDFHFRGWPHVGGTLTGGLFLFPYLGSMLGFNQALRRGDPKPSLRDARFGMRTLMILTAYLALLFGLGMRVSRVSNAVNLSLVRSQNAVQTADLFRKILDQNLANVGRSANAEALRAGRIPEGLDPSQAEFLKSLDATATEDFKKLRYGAIADGEQRQADLAVKNVDVFRRLVAYQEQLAEKYAKAAKEPWLPVAPDPPPPQ